MSAPPRSPVTADQIQPGDPYEISEGQVIEVMPTGRRGSRRNLAGGAILDTDPAVASAGVDTGFSPAPNILRAPDVSVGNVSDEPGWATEAPALAVEYADRGQNEADLQTKILQLLEAGTRWVWVVRLHGSPRVEVYQLPVASGARAEEEPTSSDPSGVYLRGRPARVAYPGEQLEAPGVLKNPVPVEALYDREAAHEVTLRNLLQRKGYESLDALRRQAHDEGRDEGRKQGLLEAVRDLCEMLEIRLPPEQEPTLKAMGVPELTALRDRLKRERRWPEDLPSASARPTSTER